MIHTGDCVEVMRTLPDASVDAVVTDPPYGLEFMGKSWDRLGDVGTTSHSGPSAKCRTCGKWAWAYPERKCNCEAPDFPSVVNHQSRLMQAWHEQWATEAFRVLKPGGYLLAFGGTRTVHRLASAIEDAGFEIRDTLMWIYASGFPKSLDVSKALDKVRDDVPDVRVVCRWLRAKIEGHSDHSVQSIAATFGFHPRMVEHWAARDTDSQPTLPTLEQWDQLRGMLGFDDAMDAEVLRLNLRKGEPGEAWAGRPVTGTVEEWANRTNYALTSRDGLRRDIPLSDLARKWEGWGTALKPAHEPIVMARKPLQGTVAANVTRWGTGALNIDATRIGTDTVLSRKDGGFGANFHDDNWEPDPLTSYQPHAGRWPSNVLLQDAELFDVANPYVVGSGATTQSKPFEWQRDRQNNGDGNTFTMPFDKAVMEGGFNDSGGYSRFFIIPKADRAEREPVLRGQLTKQDVFRGNLPDNPRCLACGLQRIGALGAEACSCEEPEWAVVGDKQRENAHPTVKPVDLMRHLVRLVTPPGGTVLDPFLGSGTTAIACELEGFPWIGVEREPEYVALAEARLNGTQRGLGLDVPAPTRGGGAKHRGNKDREGRPTLGSRRSPTDDSYSGGWMGTEEDPAACEDE